MASASAAPVSRAPAPVAAPLSPQAMAQFMDLKRSLGEIPSWELTSSDNLDMMFSEGGNEQQARTFAAVLK